MNYELPTFSLPFGRRRNGSASIIGWTCVFDAKKHKIVCTILAVSSCAAGNKKLFEFLDFCSALPSLLIERCCKNRHYSIENRTCRMGRFSAHAVHIFIYSMGKRVAHPTLSIFAELSFWGVAEESQTIRYFQTSTSRFFTPFRMTIRARLTQGETNCTIFSVNLKRFFLQ